MAIWVKVCGINSVGAADAVLRAGADYAGLVFHPASPRNVAPELASRLAARLRGRVRVVALLSDPSNDAIAAASNAAQADFLQLHGKESPKRVAEIRVRFGKPIIKALPVADAGDLANVREWEDVADMLLFDARPPRGAVHEGGHGAAFDWQLLRGRTFRKPWLLAGGLNPENVARAIRTAEAPGADVSSGVESGPGVKDPARIAAFVSNARAAHVNVEGTA